MKQNGFTLIELLAVIVILALLMAFVFPSVINSIKKSSDKVDEMNLELIYNAADTYISKHKNDFPKIDDNKYIISLKTLVEEGLLIVPIKTSNKNEDITDSKSVQVTYTNTFKYELKNNEDCKTKYSNGTVVYFDVKEGKVCSENEYRVKNSNTGFNGYTNKDQSNNETTKLDTQNSCLKFYAFNDESDDRLNLLLDHNTTSNTYWTNPNTSTNLKGPDYLLNSLYNDTKNWKGTTPPTNYEVSYGEGYANYILNYSNPEKTYNARIITAQEIAQIIGYENFDGKLSSSIFFQDKSTNISTGLGSVCAKSEEGCTYGWLYDRSSSNCETNGCFSNETGELTSNGYWLSTASVMETNKAWYILAVGSMNGASMPDSLVIYNNHGVRPVIEISKEKLRH